MRDSQNNSCKCLNFSCSSSQFIELIRQRSFSSFGVGVEVIVFNDCRKQNEKIVTQLSRIK